MSAKPISATSPRHAWLLVGVALAVVFLWLLSPADQPQTQAGVSTETPVVTVGVVGPMSGGMAALGRSVRQAVELQVEEWNEKGGLLGRPIRLLVEDDHDDPDEAISAAHRLVQAGVWGVIGHLTSAASLPASAVYQSAGIPQITPSSTDPRLTEQGFRNVFRTCGRDDQQGLVAAEFALNALHPRRVVIIHDSTTYGKALADTFRRRIAQRDRRLIVGTFSVPPSGKTLPQLLGAIASKRPDVVYFGGVYRVGGPLIKKLRDHGMTATFVTGDGMIGTELITVAGEEAATGTYLTFAPNPLLLPSADGVIRRFQARYGVIGPYTLYAYDAAGALFTAIAKRHPRDSSRSQLAQVSQTLRQMAYKGALGVLRWDEKGDLTSQPYVIYQVRRGGSFQGWFEQLTGIPRQL